MLTAEQMLDTIDDAYEARVRGDKEKLKSYWAPDATFRIAGASSLIGDARAGPAHPHEAVSALVDQFSFDKAERVDAVVQGNKAAVHWRITVSVPGKAPVTTELLDLFEFDDDGKAKSLTQFADTALIKALVS